MEYKKFNYDNPHTTFIFTKEDINNMNRYKELFDFLGYMYNQDKIQEMLNKMILMYKSSKFIKDYNDHN